MKRITIQSIAALLVLWLAACSSLRTGSGQGEKDSIGGLNAAQGDNRPAPGAQDVKQQGTDTQVARHPSKDAKSPGARSAEQHVKYAKQRGKDVKRPMANTRLRVRQQDENFELQIIETQDVDQVVIDVMQPTEEIKAQSVEVIEQTVQPAVIVDTYDTIVMPQARMGYRESPARPECTTAYENWVEVRVQ